MKILFITDLYPIKESEKKTPKTLLNFVKEWQKQGHEVDVIKPNFLLNSFLRGKPFYKSGLYGNILNLNFITPFWKVKPLNKDYDIAIAHMPSGILFADKLGIPFVAGIHNSDLVVLTNPLYKIHFKNRMEKALKNAKAIACRSYIIKKKLLKLYPQFEGKTFVTPSGINTDIICNQSIPSLNSGEKDKKKLKVLTCANLIKRKNIDKVIEACKGNYKLTVIGDGKLLKRLKKLDKNVTFTGWLPPEKVYEQMRKADVFILPSIGETFGMVYLEAMAQGCITVCTRNDGIDGIIKDGENGFLTEPNINSIKEILDKINSLSQDERKLLQDNTFNTISRLTSNKCALDYLQNILKIS